MTRRLTAVEVSTVFTMAALPQGVSYCGHCNGYGSSLKDPPGVDHCTLCGGTGLMKEKK